MSPLTEIHAMIDARVRAIREDRPDWWCGKGCDTCCRRLAELPRLTAAEWELLRDGLAALSPQRLDAIGRDLAALANDRARPLVCPLLEPSTGSCPVYTQRPVACRSYGFYVQRQLGLYCPEIEVRVADGSLADVVWGNHDAIDQRLADLGESRPLTEWFGNWRCGE
jgi:Fe-S-cluster containining protein